MTGPEVTAAMKVEDVDAGLVERAVQARYDSAREGGGTAWSDLPPGTRAYVLRRHGAYMRHALAAVLPEIQAQALRDAADEWQTREWANVPRRADRVADRLGAAQYVCDWLRKRATRQTATTKEPTT